MRATALALILSLFAFSAEAAGMARTTQEMTVTSADGTPLKAFLSLPKGKGPHPVVITVHGGEGGRDMAVVRSVADPASDSPTVQMLNAEPWAVLSIGYRAGAILGPEDEDVVAAIRHAKADSRLDGGRVAMVGGSHGGHVVLRAAIMTGSEASCVVAGSPWMTNPALYLRGDFASPPLSELRPQSVRFIQNGREQMLQGLARRGLAGEALDRRIAEKSIEANAAAIRIPALFLISEADVQVPHTLVEPTIAAMRAADRPVEVLKVKDSLHGFYWGRTGEFGARAGAGPKTDVQRAEEAASRDAMRTFLQRCLQ